MNPQLRIITPCPPAMPLTEAILIYRARHPSQQHAYASIHKIGFVDGRPTILAGRPATPGASRRLAAELCRGGAGPRGFIDRRLLYADGDIIAWWAPPSDRHCSFRCPDSPIGERGAVVPHPGLVFLASSTAWHVWAYKGKGRPDASTPMFQAPYLNVDNRGGICVGNVVRPNGTSCDTIDQWEGAFFGSFFTHPNTGEHLVRFRGGVYEFWLAALNNTFRTFPQRVLVPLNRTLRDLIFSEGGQHG